MDERSQLDPLGERVAIVTGGSRGIGFAIARALVARGMRVTIAGRDADALASAAASMDGGDRVLPFAADVAELDEVQQLVQRTVDRFGRLDVLVNNAGIGGFSPIAEMPSEMWHAIIDTNLTGVFYCCQAAIPHLRRRGGWIVNISSLAGKNAINGGGAYCASKAALNAFSEVLMQEIRYDGIRVSYIMPGSVDTEFMGPGRRQEAEAAGASWKIAAGDVAAVVIDLLETPARTLPSRIEMRPSQPKK
ncbi:MAG TPA: SDR family oxidoreductase [Vicinamibacterales bacterium]|nr:SDR family oxidoreductase [Vicinamibacterales bacterium]